LSKRDITNIAHSVQQRLLNLARQTEQDYNRLLVRYAIERLIQRIVLSPYADRFILKGAMLFTVWSGQQYRTTQDLDMLGQGENSSEQLTRVFREIATTKVPTADGMNYLPETIQSEIIREEMKYEGVRIHMDSTLGNARIPLLIDVGFGDAVIPDPEYANFPVLLGDESPRIRVYPQEAVIAEKFEAMVALGQPNSRVKDFADIWFLSQHFQFDGKRLAAAIDATFTRRGTALQPMPLALTTEFASDATKHTQWSAFIRRTKPQGMPVEFTEVVKDLAVFLGPVAKALTAEIDFIATWMPRGPWVT